MTATLGLAIVAVPAAQAALPGTPASCTWTNNTTSTSVVAGETTTSPPVLAVATTDNVSVTCTDLASTLAVVFSSPLAGVIQPTAAQITAGENPAGALTNIAVLQLGFGGGSLGSTVVPITSGALGSDPNAQCPPTQAQVDAGLTNCALAVATAAATQESVVFVTYRSGPTNPSPAQPTLAITNGANGFVAGNSVSVTDGASNSWWSYLTQGAPVPLAGIPNPAVIIDGTTPAPASAVTVAKPVYVNGNCHGSPVPSCGGVGGTLTPPALGGSFTWPTGLSSGPHAVNVFALDLAPAGTTAASVPYAFACPPAPFPCITNSNTVLASQQGAATQTSAFSPISGQGGAGNTLTFNVGPVDTQGAVICQPVFLNGVSAPVSAPATPAGCPTGALGDVGTATGQSTGTLHVSIPMTALTTPGPNFIYLAWDPAGSPQQLILNYTVSALATNCGYILGSGATSTPSLTPLPSAPPSTSFTSLSTSCTASEVIHQQVIGTASGLKQTTQQTGTNPAPPDVNMTDVTLNGFQQTSTGALNTDVVQDIRGTLVGWTVSAVFQDDLQGPAIGSHHSIPVSGFNWTPGVSLNVGAPTPSGFLSDVTAGAATASGFDKSVANGGGGTARTLCYALPGGGGGTFNCAAGLTLVVPAGVAAGAYSAVLQITVT